MVAGPCAVDAGSDDDVIEVGLHLEVFILSESQCD